MIKTVQIFKSKEALQVDSMESVIKYRNPDTDLFLQLEENENLELDNIYIRADSTVINGSTETYKIYTLKKQVRDPFKGMIEEAYHFAVPKLVYDYIDELQKGLEYNEKLYYTCIDENTELSIDLEQAQDTLKAYQHLTFLQRLKFLFTGKIQ
jgi:hypothetical protein